MTASDIASLLDATDSSGDRPQLEPRVLILAEVGPGDVVAVMQSLRATLPPGARLLTRITAQAEDTVSARNASLNTRQWEVFALLSEGLTNKQIARRLGLSHFTVRNYVCHILLAVGARSRREAARTFVGGSDTRSGSAEPSA